MQGYVGRLRAHLRRDDRVGHCAPPDNEETKMMFSRIPRAIASMLGLVYWGTAEPEMHRSMEQIGRASCRERV